MSSDGSFRLDRREALKWMMAAAAGTLLGKRNAFSAATAPNVSGYGTDPVLTKTYRPGELWPLTFTDTQRRTAAALCEVIIPADGRSPSAATLSVHDFIDEWISAPYPEHTDDQKVILDGLAWLDAESQQRFGLHFDSAVGIQKYAICDDICLVAKAKDEFKSAANFFNRFRDLTAGGFYTTPEGMTDLQYVGNVPLTAFPDPPLEILQRLGLDSTGNNS